MAEPTMHHYEVALLMTKLHAASAAIAALGPLLLEFRPPDDGVRSDCLTQMLAAQGRIFQIGQHVMAEAVDGASDPSRATRIRAAPEWFSAWRGQHDPLNSERQR